MKQPSYRLFGLGLGGLLLGLAGAVTRPGGERAQLALPYAPTIPRTWDRLALAAAELPLATPGTAASGT